MSIELLMPSNHLILCSRLLLLPTIFPSIMVFSNESVILIRWPKYWSFSFSVSLSNKYSGLISFRIDWLDLLEVQGTLKSHRCSQSHTADKSRDSDVQSLWLWITINWKILKEMGIPDHLTCLVRNLYAGQEATVRTGHGKTDWFQIGKGVRQGCILSLCLF